MKKKKELPRLTLNRETIQQLDTPVLLRAVMGGDPPSTQICCPSNAIIC
ncbi:MAG TPA: hypothetical protein VFE33_16360 [Thermoanaerobaculia bacterium]|nr:hypothetical protein [Thermoanaerobaculia bacterium]